MTTVAPTPRTCAAYATPAAWFPALAATTPAGDPPPRLMIAPSAASAPRTLKLPVTCMVSSASHTRVPALPSTLASRSAARTTFTVRSPADGKRSPRYRTDSSKETRLASSMVARPRWGLRTARIDPSACEHRPEACQRDGQTPDAQPCPQLVVFLREHPRALVHLADETLPGVGDDDLLVHHPRLEEID